MAALLTLASAVAADTGGGSAPTNATANPAPSNASASTPASALRHLTVDASRPTGRLRSLLGVNGAPAPGFHKPIRFQFGGWNVPDETDATPATMRHASTSSARTTRTGPGDVDAVFPDAPNTLIDGARTALSIFPDPDADPNDPSSYRFEPTDRLIASIKGTAPK
ncbi:MAG: hypothetical protein WDO56_08520 [Gammaproteobacteria bacterium]